MMRQPTHAVYLLGMLTLSLLLLNACEEESRGEAQSDLDRGISGGEADGATLGGEVGDHAMGGELPHSSTPFNLTITVTNDQDRDLNDAIARSGIPIPKVAQLIETTHLALIDDMGRQLPAQFHPLARWGGVMDDRSLPIRWLEVTLIDTLSAQQTKTYQVIQLDTAPPPDPEALTVSEEEGRYLVNTGAFTAWINPDNPALVDRVERLGEALYEHQAGSGLQLTLTGSSALGTHDPNTIQIDPDSFQALKHGPLQASFAIQGHWVDPLGLSRCQVSEESPDYESLGFTIVITFTRGQPHLDLEIQARNECGDLFNGGLPWEGAISVDELAWRWPLSLGADPKVYYTASGELSETTGSARVEQARGGGEPWTREAQVLVRDDLVTEREELASPCVGVSGDLIALAQMPWMRFREPQALSAHVDQGLMLGLLSQPTVIGATKGLWYRSRISLLPSGSSLEELSERCAHSLAHLERALLIRAALPDLNAAQVFPSLGDLSPTTIKGAYVETLNRIHNGMLGERGQLARHKTYGAQLWPDTQVSSYVDEEILGGPIENAGSMNYWNPSRVELYEFLRTGDPKWAWDFAIPATWLHLFTTYGNAGEHTHGNRNGVALNSGACPEAGCEDGQWHRYAFGSDDYTYTIGNLAYVIHPSYPLSRRFAIAGQTVLNRYSTPKEDEGEREPYVDQVDLTRQVIQHFAQLSNCAEFVGGAEGRACHERLIELISEIARDQLSSGLMCIGDLQGPERLPCQPDPEVEPNAEWCDCVSPQQFMNNSLIYPFLMRIYLNYGDLGGALYHGLTQSVWYTYRNTLGIPEDQRPRLPQDATRPPIPVEGDWLGQPGWDRDIEPYEVVDVDVFDDDPQTRDPSGDEANLLLWPNKAQQVSLFMIAHSLDPELNLCAVARDALDNPAISSFWEDYEVDSGWGKGSAQMMQSVVFGVGLYDTCEAQE